MSIPVSFGDAYAPASIPAEIVIDDWTPVPEPVEDDPEEGVQHQAYVPMSSALVAEVRQLQEAVEAGEPAPHIAALDPWNHMTQGDREDHIVNCMDGCELCEGHRMSCHQCGHDVDVDDEHCGSCGEHWPTSRDFSDTKGNER